MTSTPAPAIAAIGFGAYISAGFIRDIYFALKSKEWPTTSGRVLELGIVAATAGYIALTSRVPAWTAKLFGANQRVPTKTPDGGAS